MPDPSGTTSYAFGPYRLIPGRRRLLDDRGEPVALRGKSFDLLRYLVRHSGRLVEKQELLDAVWPGTVVEENNLNQAMSALRQALGDDAQSPRYIATIKGRGFQFIGDVVESPGMPHGGASSRRAWTWALTVTLLVAALATALYFGRYPAPRDGGSPVVERFGEASIRLVTDEAGSQSDAALSPDGTMIAYISDAGGSPQVWVRNLQRGGPMQITNGRFPAASPTWSPQSDQILFTRVEPDGPSIFSVGTLGSPEPRRIVAGGSSPRYPLYAGGFVYSVNDEIWLAGDDASDRRRIEGVPDSQGFAARTPALSPDGQTIAFVHAEEGPFGNLWLIPATGGEARQITSPELVGGFAANPEWSSDGRYVVFDVAAGTSGSHLWRVDTDSGEAAAMTKGPGGALQPTVSADGLRLAYTDSRPVWQLTRIDAESGARSAIYESRNPIFLPVVSPDASRIVFFSLLSSGMQLFVIDIDGRNLRQLTFNDPGRNTLPTWAGTDAVAYYHDRSLHVLDLDDGSDSELYADFHWSSRTWLAIQGEQLTYHEVDRPAQQRRTVVREIGESDITELGVAIEGAQWSTDGSMLLGSHRQTNTVVICSSSGSPCRPIESDGQPIDGFRPEWSTDERQVYFLRKDNSGDCCALWRVDRDGGGRAEPVGQLEGFQQDNSYYGIDAGGNVVYNHMDDSTDEIWLAIIDE